jgi:hypothetical protein
VEDELFFEEDETVSLADGAANCLDFHDQWQRRRENEITGTKSIMRKRYPDMIF